MPPARKDEHPEYPFAGPFPGLQSEVAPSQIGNAGFAEIQNLILRNSTASIVPEFRPVNSTSPDGTPIMGIFDFFNVRGARLSGVWTIKGMFWYNNGAWTEIPPGPGPPGTNLAAGVPFTTDNQHYFQWAVVGYKLYFSQQLDVIQVWDGVYLNYAQADEWPIPHPPGFIPTQVHPVPAKYLMELDFHLIVANTKEQASPTVAFQFAPNRLHWSATGDGSNWSDFSAGQNDLFNNLGPITGMTRLFQSGYVFQQLGVTMLTPTGDALAPFRFTTMGAYAKGNTFPYAVAAFGELIAAYIGRDDIYIFDGTSSQPIGQHPIDGNRRLGARTRIFADLFSVTQAIDPNIGYNQSNVWGVIMTAANGVTMEAYWLFIPPLNKAWVYNFDESNWTQMLFQSGRLNGPALSSFWAPQPDPGGPFGFRPIDSITIADNAAPGGPNVSYLDFATPGNMLTSNSINSGDGWYIKSGNLDFDDNRHPHTVNKVRMVLTDVGRMQFYIRFTNEVGYQTPKQLMTLGEGTGKAITTIVDLQNGITGKYIVWELSGPPGQPFQLVEITPYPVLGGEVMTRCEVVVNPPELPPPGQGIQVSISPGSASLAPGATQLFTATVTNSSNQNVTWSVDHGTINAGGLYTAPPSITVATIATITATSVADTTISSTVHISIQPGVQPISVTIAPTGGSVTSGNTLQFSAIVNNSTNQTVTWSVSAGTITSPGGLFTAQSVTASTNVTITATPAADTSVHGTVIIAVQPPTGTTQLDLVLWWQLSQKATQHLAGDPSAPYHVDWVDTDPGYPANYPKGAIWAIKNKLGNPWDVLRYDSQYISHWITENGDSADQAACQAANGTSCWMYARAYKRVVDPYRRRLMPRYFTPNSTITLDTAAPNPGVRTTNCESTITNTDLGPIHCVTTGPFKISWGGSIDKGSGTLASGPNYDNVNGVDTIKNSYQYTHDASQPSGYSDIEDTYYVLGFGRVAWYYYHAGTFKQKTVNTTLASGGHPVINFPCGSGKSWFV